MSSNGENSTIESSNGENSTIESTNGENSTIESSNRENSTIESSNRENSTIESSNGENSTIEQRREMKKENERRSASLECQIWLLGACVTVLILLVAGACTLIVLTNMDVSRLRERLATLKSLRQQGFSKVDVVLNTSEYFNFSKDIKRLEDSVYNAINRFARNVSMFQEKIAEKRETAKIRIYEKINALRTRLITSKTRLDENVTRLYNNANSLLNNATGYNISSFGPVQEVVNNTLTDLMQNVTVLRNGVLSIMGNLRATASGQVSSFVTEVTSNLTRISATLANLSRSFDEHLAQQENRTRAIELLKNAAPTFYTSCAQAFEQFDMTTSGYYTIRDRLGATISVYCEMKFTCGNVVGGWRRLSRFDVDEPNSTCPSNLAEHLSPRACIINTPNAQVCSSTIIPKSDFGFSRLCGRVIGYHRGATGAFYDLHHPTLNPSIDIDYLDGVSITYGSNPRKHVWSFAAASDQSFSSRRTKCFCITSSTSSPPYYVGSDYFCASSFVNSVGSNGAFSVGNPLWDGRGCSSTNNCCQFNGPPWFYRNFGRTITDTVEMRVCRGQARNAVDIGIKLFDFLAHV